MGKRELLLIVAFVIVGAVVYQATAPPAGPSEGGFSLSGVVAKVRREMRGNRASAEETRVTTHELDAATKEIRLSGGYAEVTITGENRPNVEARLRITSTGYDAAEAKQLVSQTFALLKVDQAGGALRLASDYPDPGTQRAILTLAVPARLNVRIDQGPVRTSVSNVAALEMTGGRGEWAIKTVEGRATLNHRGGRVVVEDVGALKVTGRGSDVTVSQVRGDASFSMQSGELRIGSVRGPTEIESQNTEITIRKLEGAKGPFRVNATGGTVMLDGLEGEARIDGRNTDIEIGMGRAAMLTVYNVGDEPIRLTPPSGGFVLDAVATDGRVALPDDLRGQISTSPENAEREQRASGPVRGGGPTITLRATHGDIRIGARDVPARDVPARDAPKSDR